MPTTTDKFLDYDQIKNAAIRSINRFLAEAIIAHENDDSPVIIHTKLEQCIAVLSLFHYLATPIYEANPALIETDHEAILHAINSSRQRLLTPVTLH